MTSPHALAAYRRTIALAEKDARAYNDLAWLLTSEGEGRNPDEALSLARRANQLDPNNAAILDTLGWVHSSRGKYSEAEPILRKAAELAPNQAPIQYHLGMVRHQLNKREEAEIALRQALRLDARLAEAGESPGDIEPPVWKARGLGCRRS